MHYMGEAEENNCMKYFKKKLQNMDFHGMLWVVLFISL